jgi:hypothetical protein
MATPDGDRLVVRAWDRIADLGSAAQASIPGVYAWAVTVAPVAWSRGAPWLAKGAAIAGLVALSVAVLVERRSATWSRVVSVWGLVSTSGCVWALAPGASSPPRLDPIRAVLGMLGWALFALSSAAPALKRVPADTMPSGAVPLRPRAAVPRGDVVYVLGGVVFATVLQTLGWSAPLVERALLVRLVAVAGGLAVIGTSTSIALARHGRRVPAARKTRVRRAVVWLVLFGLMAGGAGLLLSR